MDSSDTFWMVFLGSLYTHKSLVEVFSLNQRIIGFSSEYVVGPSPGPAPAPVPVKPTQEGAVCEYKIVDIT